MKKKLLLGALMIITAICLCTNNQSGLQACVKEAEACPVKIKKEIRIITTGYTEDENDSHNVFMNPVSQL